MATNKRGSLAVFSSTLSVGAVRPNPLVREHLSQFDRELGRRSHSGSKNSQNRLVHAVRPYHARMSVAPEYPKDSTKVEP